VSGLNAGSNNPADRGFLFPRAISRRPVQPLPAGTEQAIAAEALATASGSLWGLSNRVLEEVDSAAQLLAWRPREDSIEPFRIKRLHALEGRPHWGQVNTLTGSHDFLAKMYPGYAAWQEAHRQLNQSRVFDSPFSKRVGISTRPFGEA